MAHFLLIHGACHGAWCWRDVVPALQASGHSVVALDLPAHGDDTTPVNKVTLDTYAYAILEALTQPAVIVAHSMGGYPITRAAEIDPSLVQRLVYVCAHTPWPGQTLAQMRHVGATQPLQPAIRMSEDRLSYRFDPKMAPDLFYQDCPAELVTDALSRHCDQPVAPVSTAVELTERSQSLPRSYVICEKDRAVPPDMQRKLADRFAPKDVYSLPCGHSPFFAMPQELALLLNHIAAPIGDSD